MRVSTRDICLYGAVWFFTAQLVWQGLGHAQVGRAVRSPKETVRPVILGFFADKDFPNNHFSHTRYYSFEIRPALVAFAARVAKNPDVLEPVLDFLEQTIFLEQAQNRKKQFELIVRAVVDKASGIRARFSEIDEILKADPSVETLGQLGNELKSLEDPVSQAYFFEDMSERWSALQKTVWERMRTKAEQAVSGTASALERPQDPGFSDAKTAAAAFIQALSENAEPDAGVVRILEAYRANGEIAKPLLDYFGGIIGAEGSEKAVAGIVRILGTGHAQEILDVVKIGTQDRCPFARKPAARKLGIVAQVLGSECIKEILVAYQAGRQGKDFHVQEGMAEAFGDIAQVLGAGHADEILKIAQSDMSDVERVWVRRGMSKSLPAVAQVLGAGHADEILEMVQSAMKDDSEEVRAYTAQSFGIFVQFFGAGKAKEILKIARSVMKEDDCVEVRKNVIQALPIIAQVLGEDFAKDIAELCQLGLQDSTAAVVDATKQSRNEIAEAGIVKLPKSRPKPNPKSPK